MDSKLTLRLKKRVIQRAKEYAHRHKVSVSKLVEHYLQSLTDDSVEEAELTPVVKELSGVIDLKDDVRANEDYGDYLEKKYQ
jgi:hypothetical protein